TLDQISHQRDFVSIELKGYGALHGEFAGNLSSFCASLFATHRVSHFLKPQWPGSGSVHCNAYLVDRVSRSEHCRSHIQQRKIPDIPVTNLFEIKLRSGPC